MCSKKKKALFLEAGCHSAITKRFFREETKKGLVYSLGVVDVINLTYFLTFSFVSIFLFNHLV